MEARELHVDSLPGEYEIKIDSTVAPVVHAPRAIPVAIREQVKKKVYQSCAVWQHYPSLGVHQVGEQYGLRQEEKRACPNLHRPI